MGIWAEGCIEDASRHCKPGLCSGRGGGGVEEKEERETEEAKEDEQPQEWSEREEETHMGIWAERCIEDASRHLDQLGTPSVRHHSAVPVRAPSRSPRINE